MKIYGKATKGYVTGEVVEEVKAIDAIKVLVESSAVEELIGKVVLVKMDNVIESNI